MIHFAHLLILFEICMFMYEILHYEKLIFILFQELGKNLSQTSD